MWEQNLSDKKFTHCIEDGNFTSNKNKCILSDLGNIQLKYALLLSSKPDHKIFLSPDPRIYRVGQIKRGQCNFFRRSKACFREFW